MALDFNPSNLLLASIKPGIGGIKPDFTAAIAAVTDPAFEDMEAIVAAIFGVSTLGNLTLEASNPPGTPFHVVISIFVGREPLILGIFGTVVNDGTDGNAADVTDDVSIFVGFIDFGDK